MKKKVKAHGKSAIHSAMLAPTHRKNVLFLRFYSFIYFRAHMSAWGGSERGRISSRLRLVQSPTLARSHDP